MPGDASLRILLIDDDKDLLDLLKYNFEKDGYMVKTISDSSKAFLAVYRFQPHLIVLDIMMNRPDGLEICRQIRSQRCFSSVPIFFLTAGPAARWRETALGMGADDFIEKLSGLRSLTNKVTAVLKNKFVIRKHCDTLVVGDLKIDQRSERLFREGTTVVLNHPEFEILFFLMQNPGRKISLVNLIEVIFGSKAFVPEGAVESYVESLRRKIGAGRIETLKGRHYRFNPGISGPRSAR